MNANAFLDDFDIAAHAAFTAAGMADMGAYTPVGAADPVDRRVYVNTNRQTLGDYNQISAPRTVIGFLLADGAVQKGAKVVVAERAYTLQGIDETDQDDKSLQWWVVKNG